MPVMAGVFVDEVGKTIIGAVVLWQYVVGIDEKVGVTAVVTATLRV